MVGLADADACHLGSATLPAPRPPALPVEPLRADVERVSQICAGDWSPIGAVQGVVVRSVDPADGYLVDAQLTRSLVEERLHGRGDLVLTWTALSPSGRRVGQDRDAPETHGRWRIDERHRSGGAIVIAGSGIRTVLLDDVQIDSRDPTVVPEAHLDAALEAGPCRADEVFFGPAHPHHHGSARLLGHIRRHHHDRIRTALRPEPAPAELRDVNEVLGLDLEISGQCGNDAALTLGGPVYVALPVLPVRHGATGLHGVVGRAGGHEGLVQNQRGFSESGLHVAVRPLGHRLAHGQLTFAGSREVLLRPLVLDHALAWPHSVALDTCVRPART